MSQHKLPASAAGRSKPPAERLHSGMQHSTQSRQQRRAAERAALAPITPKDTYGHKSPRTDGAVKHATLMECADAAEGRAS